MHVIRRLQRYLVLFFYLHVSTYPMFKAILITKDDASGYKASLQQVDDAVLPDGDVTVRVEWSTLELQRWLGDYGQITRG